MNYLDDQVRAGEFEECEYRHLKKKFVDEVNNYLISLGTAKHNPIIQKSWVGLGDGHSQGFQECNIAHNSLNTVPPSVVKGYEGQYSETDMYRSNILVWFVPHVKLFEKEEKKNPNWKMPIP